MNEVETAEIFARYLDEIGKYVDFKGWAEKQGYTLDELGFELEDEGDEDALA